MIKIEWAGGELEVRRLIISSKLPQYELGHVRAQAKRLALPVIEDDAMVVPVAGDLWVGICPKSGWGDVAGECGEARTCEALNVANRLLNATINC